MTHYRVEQAVSEILPLIHMRKGLLHARTEPKRVHSVGLHIRMRNKQIDVYLLAFQVSR